MPELHGCRTHSYSPWESATLKCQILPPCWLQACHIGKATMVHLVRTVAALIVLALLSVPAALAAEPVDLLLVLSSDVSRSVDHPKFLLQREGYAAAVSNTQVLDAIKSGPHGKIALCFVEWSGYGAQKLVIDWAVIDGAGRARKFGDPLL